MQHHTPRGALELRTVRGSTRDAARLLHSICASFEVFAFVELIFHDYPITHKYPVRYLTHAYFVLHGYAVLCFACAVPLKGFWKLILDLIWARLHQTETQKASPAPTVFQQSPQQGHTGKIRN
jgi:hypothetical protein